MSKNSDQTGNIVVGHHYDFIDGMRGFAVLLVIWFHSSNLTFVLHGRDLSGLWEYYYFFTILGLTGVDLFFVVSGFLITGILMDIEKQDHAFRKYYIRRSLRILPLYYAVFIFSLVLSIMFASQFPDFGMLLSHLIFLQNWSLEGHTEIEFFNYLNHTWTLAVEEQFYVVWPLVFWFFKKKSLRHVVVLMIFMILMSWFLRFYVTYWGYYKFAYTATFCRFDTLAMGALISVCFRHYKPSMEKFKPVFLCCVVAAFISFLLLLISQENGIEANQAVIHGGLIICSIFYGALLSYLLLCNNESRFKKLFRGRALRMTGRISYCLYLVHVPIMFIIPKYFDVFSMSFGAFQVLLIIIALPLSLVISWLSYTYFEKPILTFKDKWAPLK